MSRVACEGRWVLLHSARTYVDGLRSLVWRSGEKVISCCYIEANAIRSVAAHRLTMYGEH